MARLTAAAVMTSCLPAGGQLTQMPIVRGQVVQHGRPRIDRQQIARIAVGGVEIHAARSGAIQSEPVRGRSIG
jgi:hypothetical protein